MKRWFSMLAAGISLLLSLAVCVLWVRGRTGYDEASWSYDRYLPDRSAASNDIRLRSDRRLWLSVSSGHVGPYNGQLVWGYHVNADQSGGRPRLTFRHDRYHTMQTLAFASDGSTGFGPLRWSIVSRSKAKEGDDYRSTRVGVSHWLLALVFLAPPILWTHRLRQQGCLGWQFSLRNLFVVITLVAVFLGVIIRCTS